MIEVQAPDGSIVEFPAGTPPETIKGVMVKRFPMQGAAPPATPSTPTAPQAMTPAAAPQQPHGQGQGSGVLGTIAGLPRAAYDAVVGKQDPRFAGLPSIERASGIIDPQAEMFGVSDEAYADIYKKNLGDRFIGMTRDANNYPIIRFRGKDGQEQQAYVNRPGLDTQDVNRAISSSLPYVAVASGVGKVAQGAGTLGAMALQSLGAMATSGTQDAVATSMGSEQGLDTNRMLMAGGFAAGGELAGRVALPFLRKIIGDRALVTPDGKLTDRGRRAVEREGLDPNVVDEDLANEIRRRATVAEDPAEAITQATTDRFGIPTTKGQRTKDPQFLLVEKDIRAGTLGDAAKTRLGNLDQEQTAAIRRGALGDDSQVAPVVPSGNLGRAQSVAPTLAPARTTAEMSPDVLGDGIREGAKQAAARVKDLEREAWSLTENILPRQGATQTLPSFVQKRRGSLRVDEKLTPSAWGMAQEMDGFMKGGGNIAEGPEVLGQQSVRYIDEVRRRLMAMKDGAAPGADKTAANALYNAFDDWMVTAAQQGLLTGRPNATQALLNARRTTAELRGVLSPRVAGKKTNAARVLEKVQNADTGEEALRALLGSSGPSAALPDGAVQALRHYKAAALTLAGPTGKNAWNDVRLANWLKLVTGKNGEMLSPRMVEKNIQMAFKNRPSMMSVLYDEGERKLMRQYAMAVKAASYTDPNPSGSGTAIRGLFPNLVKEQLQVQSKRELFSQHNVLMSRIYSGLAKVLPNILDGKNVMGGPAASRATSQRLTPRTPPSMAGYGSALTPAADRATNDRTEQFSPNQMLRYR